MLAHIVFLQSLHHLALNTQHTTYIPGLPQDCGIAMVVYTSCKYIDCTYIAVVIKNQVCISRLAQVIRTVRKPFDVCPSGLP